MRHVEIQEFFVEGRDQRASHVLLHITEPNTPAEFAKGYFFALIEMQNGTMAHIEQIQRIIDDLEAGFYTDHGDTQNDVETLLALINRRSQKLLSGKDFHLEALLGILSGNSLTLAYRGEPRALLFYRQQQEFGAMNILEGATDTRDSEELFPVVLHGELNTGDFLFVATPEVTKHISSDRLQKIITARSVTESSKHIEKVLNDIHSDTSFGGILFRILAPASNSAKERAMGQKESSTSSLNKLMDQKRKTADTLSPPFLKHLRDNKKNEEISYKEQENLNRTQRRATSEPPKIAKEPRTTPREPRNISNLIFVSVGRTIVTLVILLAKALRLLFRSLGQFFVFLFILITNKNNSRKEMIALVQEKYIHTRQKIKNLPLISKILFLFLVLALIILGTSVSVIRIREVKKAQEAATTQLLGEIKSKQDAADARLIYQDNTTALALLNDAKQLANQIPSSKDTEAQKQEVQNKIDETVQKLQKMTIVTPELLADFSTSSPNDLTFLTRTDNTIMAYGEQNPKVYAYTLANKTITPLDHTAIPSFIATAVPKEDDTLIFITRASTLAAYQKDTNTIVARDIAFPSIKVSLAAGAIYNTRLYTLDTTNNQIYKHNKTQTGFDKGQVWLKTSIDLSTAVSMAIDTDMYVLFQDATVKKYTKGTEQPFTLDSIEPALTAPTQIWTYADIPYLFILDPKNQRIILFDKSGKLVRQYKAKDWKEPTGMTIDYPAKTVYILDQKKLSRFSW